jgi:hypothetical protein
MMRDHAPGSGHHLYVCSSDIGAGSLERKLGPSDLAEDGSCRHALEGAKCGFSGAERALADSHAA